MIIEHKEDINSDFQGTIIDIEFIGDFNRFFLPDDSRRYKDMKQVILGFINKETLHIYCAKGMEAIAELDAKTPEIIDGLERPFLAFHCHIASGLLFYLLGSKLLFDGELNKDNFERKGQAVKELNIDNYDDPFFNDGSRCSKAWKNSKFNEAIAHNRACLLKERDILINRLFRKL